MPIDAAIETTSANFKTSQDYGLTIYVKTSEWMYMLENTVGMEKVDAAFQNYFNLWKFKHPQPADMKVVFEQSLNGNLNGNLNGFFGLLNKQGKLVE